MSPSVWWNGRALLDEVDAFQGASRPRIWLDVGGREGQEAIADVRALRLRLLQKGWVEPGFPVPRGPPRRPQRTRLGRTREKSSGVFVPGGVVLRLVTVDDTLGRPLRDLRISVTDRCNFRCPYCMPREVFGPSFVFLSRHDLLTFEEIARAARLFVACGVEKIRLTGGEPLLRRDLDRLIAMLAPIEGLRDLTLTTNGSLLTVEKARALKAAGLQRITISLDSLDDAVFRSMNDADFPVANVLDAIDAAAAAGLAPLKIDMVVKRGINEAGIVDMARHFRGSGHIVRFIEYMDVGNSNEWRLDQVVPAREILDRIRDEWPIEPAEPNYFGEVAERWRYTDGAGEIGVIASVSQPFCGSCTRARLSAEGEIFTCLFAARGFDLRGVLRSGASDEEVTAAIAGVWTARTDRYSEIRSEETRKQRKVEMYHIGG